MTISYKTAISRQSLSSPAKYLAKENLFVGRILDYGSGRGDLARFLKVKQPIEEWDPHWSPKEIIGKFDTIYCGYVLNVLPKKERESVVESCKSLLNPGGKIYFAVRRDLKESGKTKRGYQYLVRLPFPLVVETSSFAIYVLCYSN